MRLFPSRTETVTKIKYTFNHIARGSRKGSALLVVLFLVIAISTLSVGYVAVSDMELGSGVNMSLRVSMEYLAESGLEHARAMLLVPQEASGQYWTGQTQMQLGLDDDFYDVQVERDSDDYRRYSVRSEAYRNHNGENIGLNRLKAEVVLDPAVALWVGQAWSDNPNVTVIGDVSEDGNIEGVQWPGLTRDDYVTSYYVETDSYSAQLIAANSIEDWSGSGVWYYDDDLTLAGNVEVYGTLVVNGNLIIEGNDNTVEAMKNFPAILVFGEVRLEDAASLMVEGLAQVRDRVVFAEDAADAHLKATGALFIRDGGIEGLGSVTCDVEVIVHPDLAAIEIWDSNGNRRLWSPAGRTRLDRIQRW